MRKVFLFGIDGASPELIFDKWINKLPHIKKLMANGIYGQLNSTIPPVTIIAWNAMLSGKDPSEIGVFSYTFQDENGKSQLASSKNVSCNLIWDILGEKNKKTISLYVPLTFPVKPINGCMISGFLSPGINSNCAYPKSLKNKLKLLKKPELFFDVAVGLASHKALGTKTLLKRTYEMTDMQIKIIKELIVEKKWDVFITVMIGTDRLQHMLWRHFDPKHRRFIKNSPHKNALKEYYIYLDKKLGEILALLDKDTDILIVSDHGMIRQEGKININNWLIKEGYLVLKVKPRQGEKQRFDLNLVDMDKTLVYATGAYHARIFINKKKISNGYEEFKKELIEKLKNIPDDRGRKLDTKIYATKDIYKDNSSPECPDLIIYFDNLKWASNPDLGQKGLYSWESAVGADSAGHSTKGIFILNSKNITKRGRIKDVDIQQITPTILKLLNLEIPKEIEYKPIGNK